MFLKNSKKLLFDPQAMYKAMDGIALILAKEYAELLIKNIETNKFGNKNAESTLAQKKGSTPLVDSGELLRAIVVEKTVVKMKTGLHSSGLLYDELMSILEYGRMDKSILPYSVWSQTHTMFQARVKELTEEKLNKVYSTKKLRKK